MKPVSMPPAKATPAPKPVTLLLAAELAVREAQVAAAVALLDGGATVPFVAR